MAKKPSTPSHVRAALKYNQTHTRQISIKLNLDTDRDVIAQLLKQPSIQGYIKDLVREDIYREKHEKPPEKGL